MSKIHPTAVIAEGADIGRDVEIGAYTVIGPQVKIGQATKIAHHAVLEGDTQIGERCQIFSGACVGGASQDKKSKGAPEGALRIGDENTIREYVTINVAAQKGSSTVIGHRNLLMIGCHIAHDCVLGNDIIIVNGVPLAGNVTVEDGAVIGGMAGVHQFVRLGKLSMTGGLSKVTVDVPPFSLCDGNPMTLRGINSVGLKRAGYSSKDSLLLKKVIKILFGNGSSLTRAIEKVKNEFGSHPDVLHLLSFIEGSKRGVARFDHVLE
jgi:UDP-N-acetylglucosamine acyltransferase